MLTLHDRIEGLQKKVNHLYQGLALTVSFFSLVYLFTLVWVLNI